MIKLNFLFVVRGGLEPPIPAFDIISPLYHLSTILTPAFYDISLAVLNLRRNTAIVHNITCIASYLLIDLFYFFLYRCQNHNAPIISIIVPVIPTANIA